MTARSLRHQLTRASLLTTLAALVASATLILAYEFFSYRQQRIDELRAQADLIARSVTAALIFHDPGNASAQLQPLNRSREIEAAVIYDGRGAPFARFAAEGVATPARMPLGLRDGRFDGRLLELAYPVVHEGERVGTVYLRMRHDVQGRLATYAAIQAFVGTLALALALVVFGRLQKAVTEPLGNVSRVAREVMARRDWTLRAGDGAGNAEIAALVQSFNDMLAEVETRAREVEHEMAERLRAEEQLRAADRKKDVFLATLAHELRNPLAPMMNAVGLLRLSATPEAVRARSLAILDRQLRHLVRLIDDLLDVSRIATGKLSLLHENVDLGAVVKAAVEVAEPAARDRGLALALHAAPAAHAVVVGDGARLQQVFSNLLANACRYTPAGGHIDVALAVHGREARVSVHDTGIGIDPGMQERIFELFEQADKSLERGNAGLGIGLTLARQLVQLHGGQIAVASDGVGRGSTFTVRLPLADADVVSVAAAGGPEPAPLRSLRLLVADDNVDYAVSLREMLEALGHDVTVVHDGHAALAAGMKGAWDAVVLDIGMPGLNGYEVAQRLRSRTDGVAAPRLVAVSGWGQHADKARAAEAGFDRHLTKPVTLEVLLEALQPGTSTDTALAASIPGPRA